MGQKCVDLCLLSIHGTYLDEEDKEALLVRSTDACLKSYTKETTDLRPSTYVLRLRRLSQDPLY